VESVKFAITILVFLVFEKLAPTFHALLVDVLKQTFLALIAGAITYGVTEVFFGRPTAELRWCIRDEIVAFGTPELTIRPGGKQVLQLQLHVVGGAGLARWVCARSRTRPMELTITLHPRDLVIPSKQRFGHDVRVAGNKITFVRTNGLKEGLNDTIEVAFRKRLDGAAMTSPLEFSTELRSTSHTRIPFGRLVKIDSSVDGFTVRAA
jgi:hypothetical protein